MFLLEYLFKEGIFKMNIEGLKNYVEHNIQIIIDELSFRILKMNINEFENYRATKLNFIMGMSTLIEALKTNEYVSAEEEQELNTILNNSILSIHLIKK